MYTKLFFFIIIIVCLLILYEEKIIEKYDNFRPQFIEYTFLDRVCDNLKF